MKESWQASNHLLFNTWLIKFCGIFFICSCINMEIFNSLNSVRFLQMFTKNPTKQPTQKWKKSKEVSRKYVIYLYSSSRCNLYGLRYCSISSVIFLWYKLKCCLPRMISMSNSNIPKKKKHHQSSEHNVSFLKFANWFLNLLLLILNFMVERRICL